MQKNIQKGTNGITLIALVITIIVLLILAGVTIAMLTGSDSAPAKANEAKQKNDIGAAKDEIAITAQNAQVEAYDNIYVKDSSTTTHGQAGGTISQYVIQKLQEKYPANSKLGLASISVDGNGNITISTTDFTDTGKISATGGVLEWDGTTTGGNGGTTISKTTSYVGKYADLDGDGNVDGIIYADLLTGNPGTGNPPSGEWGNTFGGVTTYSLPTNVNESNVKEYEISQTGVVPKKNDNMTNLFDATAREIITLKSGDQSTKTERFFVMGLNDVLKAGSKTMYWINAYLKKETTTVGTKTYNWILPTKEQWSMFGSAFNITKNSTDETYYRNYGLSNYYWSSTVDSNDTDYVWEADFLNGYMCLMWKTEYQYVRLCTTF